MGAMNNENNAQSIQVALGTVSGDGTTLVGYMPAKAKLKSVKLISATGLVQSDTDYLVASLKVGSTTKASFSTKLTGGTEALSAGVMKKMVIADADLAENAKLELVMDETGNISIDLHAVVEFYTL